MRPGTLSNIFCGNRRPGRKLALRLAEISGVSFQDWMLADCQHLKKKVFIAWTIATEQPAKGAPGELGGVCEKIKKAEGISNYP